MCQCSEFLLSGTGHQSFQTGNQPPSLGDAKLCTAAAKNPTLRIGLNGGTQLDLLTAVRRRNAIYVGELDTRFRVLAGFAGISLRLPLPASRQPIRGQSNPERHIPPPCPGISPLPLEANGANVLRKWPSNITLVTFVVLEFSYQYHYCLAIVLLL